MVMVLRREVDGLRSVHSLFLGSLPQGFAFQKAKKTVFHIVSSLGYGSMLSFLLPGDV
jgi:hypothetical protein